MIHTDIDQRLIENQIFESMRENNIIPFGDLTLEMDGKLHRFSVEGDRYGEKSGAYIIYVDEWPHWFIQDFRQGSSMLHFSFDKEAISIKDRRAFYLESITPEQKAREAQRKKEQRDLDIKNQKQSFLRVCKEYNSASFALAKYHPYIMEKFTKIHIPELDKFLGMFNPDFNLWEWIPESGLPFPSIEQPHTLGVVLDPVDGSPCQAGDLLIPLTDALTGSFQTLQIISREKIDGKYNKRFYKGVPIAGKNVCYEFNRIGFTHIPETDTVFLVEGFLTGLAVISMINANAPVFCAMSCGNLRNVALCLRKRYPDRKIFLMADNDKGTSLKDIGKRNPGVDTAIQLHKERIVDYYKIPPEIPGRENLNTDYLDILTAREMEKAKEFLTRKEKKQ